MLKIPFFSSGQLAYELFVLIEIFMPLFGKLEPPLIHYTKEVSYPPYEVSLVHLVES